MRTAPSGEQGNARADVHGGCSHENNGVIIILHLNAVLEGAQMRIAMFSARNYERPLLDELNAGHGHDLVYFDTTLESSTAFLAAGFPAVSVFVNDVVSRDVLKHLADGDTKLPERDC
jgi:hypothetical protein